MRQQVEETIEVIRTALQADGGDIILRDVDEATGVVSVTLIGACGTCPASSNTLKAGIERIMRDRIDGFGRRGKSAMGGAHAREARDAHPQSVCRLDTGRDSVSTGIGDSRDRRVDYFLPPLPLPFPLAGADGVLL